MKHYQISGVIFLILLANSNELSSRRRKTFKLDTAFEEMLNMEPLSVDKNVKDVNESKIVVQLQRILDNKPWYLEREETYSPIVTVIEELKSNEGPIEATIEKYADPTLVESTENYGPKSFDITEGPVSRDECNIKSTEASVKQISMPIYSTMECDTKE